MTERPIACVWPLAVKPDKTLLTLNTRLAGLWQLEAAIFSVTGSLQHKFPIDIDRDQINRSRRDGALASH